MTAERVVPLQAAQQYRVRYRSPDGSTTYESVNDTEGAELLLVRPDGSILRHVTVGVCHPCLMAELHQDGRPGCELGEDCPRVKSEEHERRLAPLRSQYWSSYSAPAKEEEPLVRMMPPPKEPAPEAGEAETAPEPPPVVDAIEQAAQELAGKIWFNGPMPRARLTVDDEVLAYAVEMKWLEVREALVVRGQVDPRPAEVPVSALEQRLPWGPGW